MLNQARIDGLLGYMEEIGLSQMLREDVEQPL